MKKINRKNVIIFLIIVVGLVFSSNTTIRGKYQELCFYPNSVAVTAVNEKILSGYEVVNIIYSTNKDVEGIYVLYER